MPRVKITDFGTSKLVEKENEIRVRLELSFIYY